MAYLSSLDRESKPMTYKNPLRKSLPKALRAKIKDKFGGHCAYCGCELGDKFQIDHAIPVERAYQHLGLDINGESNLMPACGACNNLKFATTIEEFRRTIELQIRRAREYSVNFRTAERFGLIEIREPEPIVFWFEKYLNLMTQPEKYSE